MRHPDRQARGRRFAAGLLFAAWLAVPAAAQTAGAPAHPAPAPGGAEGASGLSQVTKRVLCPCGTCVNQTLHVCTCGTAANEREQIAEALASGRSAESIVQQYVDRYGVQILTTPEKEGLNFIGWLVPFAVTLSALATLSWVLLGWARRPAPAMDAGTQAAIPVDPADRGYREALERDLRDFKA